jgi:hypothetical protein
VLEKGAVEWGSTAKRKAIVMFVKALTIAEMTRLTCTPKRLNAPITPAPTRPPAMAYSTVVKPSSSRMNFMSFFIWFFLFLLCCCGTSAAGPIGSSKGIATVATFIRTAQEWAVESLCVSSVELCVLV